MLSHLSRRAAIGAALLLTLLPPARAADDAPPGRVFRPDGQPTDPKFFPIAVWLQDPRNAEKYKGAGINLYVGLWRGPTDAQLDALKKAGIPVICDQNEVALARKDDPILAAWMHGDEPDNAQPLRNGRGYGPPVKPEKIVADYEAIRAKDPSRPVMLNLGQGVANDAWKGRGSGASKDDYPQYVKGSDIVSFDVYPVAGVSSPDRLWLVPLGLERLAKWTDGQKVLWNCLECTRISNLEHKPTPEQVVAEAWMSLAQGSRGLIYFVHQFEPEFNEHALLDDPPMLAAVTALNARIQKLAPVLNGPIAAEAGTVATAVLGGPASTGPGAVLKSELASPIAVRWHRHDGATYAIAANLRNEPVRPTFTVTGLPATATAAVVDEDRSIPVRDGRFDDAFAPFAAHVYRIAP